MKENSQDPSLREARVERMNELEAEFEKSWLKDIEAWECELYPECLMYTRGGKVVLREPPEEGSVEDLENEFRYLKKIIRLMRELTKLGYNRKLRPGCSLHTLTLSRSKEYSLRDDQHFVGILARNDQPGLTISYVSSARGFYQPEEEMTVPFEEQVPPELIEMLERLCARPID